MKLLIVTCISEHVQIATEILKKARINIFSTNDTIGRKIVQPINLSENWFGKIGEQYDSVVLFSFTDELNAANALSLVNEKNVKMLSDYPIHAFILPVERASD